MADEGEHLFQVRYAPDRRKGFLLYGISLLFSLIACGFGLFFLLRSSGAFFVLWLFLFLVGLAAIPFLGFSLYGLLNAYYQVTREGIRLRWGMREVFLPMGQVEWVRSAESVVLELHLPPWSWSGIIRGMRRTRELGDVEFMANDPGALILVATPGRVFALSPRDANQFARAIQYAMESGSLSPVSGFSVEPSTFLSQLWQDRMARGLIAAGSAFNLALLVISNLIVPQRAEIILGGQSQTPIPTGSLLLLSMVSIGAGLVDFLLGMNFYRRPEYRMLSYLLWGSSGILPFLLTLAIALAVR